MNRTIISKKLAHISGSENQLILHTPYQLVINRCRTTSEIRRVVWEILRKNSDLFPKSKSSLILLKPNLNSDMCALTGNTTDLRILSAILAFLDDKGYTNVIIGDGTSTGFINVGINVISRLKIDSMVEKFGFRTLDLNKAPSVKVKLDGRTEIRIARICFECDLFINLPKLKTHAEAGISICLKNLIGCVVGLDKQKLHYSLFENITRLNEVLHPDLCIVDGVIAMEGTGPSRGNPVKLGLIVSGRNPVFIDHICMKLMGFDLAEVPYLKMLKHKKSVGDIQNAIDTISFDGLFRRFESPKFSLASIVNAPKYRSFFVRLRYQRGLSNLYSSRVASNLLYMLKARQDMFIKKNSTIKIYYEKKRCINCRLCLDYCPMNIEKYNEIGDNERCIDCLYCFFVCPKDAIILKGDLGYLKHQIEKYAKSIRARISDDNSSLDYQS